MERENDSQRIQNASSAVERETSKVSHLDGEREAVLADQELTNFVWVNLTNPTIQSTDPKIKRFVRQQVQRKYKKHNVDDEDSERFSRPQASDLPFLNIQHPSQATTAGARRFVRKQVQLRSQRNLPRPEFSTDLEEDSPTRSKNIANRASLVADRYDGNYHQFQAVRKNAFARLPKKKASLLGFKVDYSSFIYPIGMDQEAYALVEYLHADSESTNIIPAFRPVYFKMILLDPASFLQMLSTTVSHQMYVQGKKDDHRAMRYQQMALRSVNERLSDPIHGISDGIVGAVVSFLTYDHIINDIQRYKIDKVGLSRIIQLRGGIETLEKNEVLRLMILWEEVCGACAFDVLPNYPPPKYHIPPIPTRARSLPSKNFINTICRLRILYPGREGFIQAFHDLYVLNSMIIEGLPATWTDPMFLGLRINPMVLRLLPKTKQAPQDDDPGAVVEMTSRLAALIYLSDIRVRFMEYHTTGYHFMNRLKNIISQGTEAWAGLLELKLWILVVGGIKASSIDRAIFIQLIRNTCTKLGLETWKQVTKTVGDFIWINEIYGARCVDLGLECMEASPKGQCN